MLSQRRKKLNTSNIEVCLKALIFCLLVSFNLFAQDYASPGPEHKILSDLAGKWTYTSKYWMSAEAKPEESKGTAINKMILGGRYLEQNVKGVVMGMPYEGHGIMGFDKIKKEFQEVWLDNMGTGMMISTASFDQSTLTMKEVGEYTSPISENLKATFRAETKLIDKDNYIYTMYGLGMNPKGKEFKMMELIYKRAD